MDWFHEHVDLDAELHNEWNPDVLQIKPRNKIFLNDNIKFL